MVNQAISVQEDDETSVQSEPVQKIPRPGLSQSFRRMKAKLFGKGPSLPVPRAAQIEFAGHSSEVSPERSAMSLYITCFVYIINFVLGNLTKSDSIVTGLLNLAVIMWT